MQEVATVTTAPVDESNSNNNTVIPTTATATTAMSPTAAMNNNNNDSPNMSVHSSSSPANDTTNNNNSEEASSAPMQGVTSTVASPASASTRTTTTTALFATEELPAESSFTPLAAAADAQLMSPVNTHGLVFGTEESTASTTASSPRGRTPRHSSSPAHCINPASEVNSRLDTQIEVRVYPCNNSQNVAGSSGAKKKYTGFTIKPEGVIIQGNNANRTCNRSTDLGAEYAMHIGRKLQRYELSDTRACQLLVTSHGKNFWVVPAPEAFSRHSGTCRLLGDRKHAPAPHVLKVGDFLRVGSVGVVVIETHDGCSNQVLSEEKIQKIMKDTTNGGGGFLDQDTDGGMLMMY
jgi:hypothetical protein